MTKVIIFGVKDFAELAHFYFDNDSDLSVAAFTVHREFLPADGGFRGLPVLPFEEIETLCPADEFFFFAPMSASGMNEDRKKIYFEAKKKGYQLTNYVSSKASVLGKIAGDNCFILEDNTIQPFTTIGSNVVLWSGNHIGHHGQIGDHTTFTSHVVMSGNCNIGESCFFGVNSTIRDGLNVKEGTFVAMSSTLTSDTDPWSAYKGNPGRKMSISSNKIKF